MPTQKERQAMKTQINKNRASKGAVFKELTSRPIITDESGQTYELRLTSSIIAVFMARSRLFKALNVDDLGIFTRDQRVFKEDEGGSELTDTLADLRQELQIRIEADELIAVLCGMRSNKINFTTYETALFSFPALQDFAKQKSAYKHWKIIKEVIKNYGNEVDAGEYTYDSNAD